MVIQIKVLIVFYLSNFPNKIQTSLLNKVNEFKF